MNIRSKRFVVVILTLIFAVSVFAVTAFAEGGITPVTEDPLSPPETSAVSSDPVSSDTGSTPSIESGSSSSEQPVSTSSASLASASSHAEATPSSKYVAPVTSFDTNANQVEATASQAAAAVSDPDVLSSENWSELLSSGEQPQSQVEAAGASAISSAASSAGVGGVSSILILGVILIVLALCGLGLFVYLQFFTNNRSGPNGRGGSGKRKSIAALPPAEKNEQEPLTFTDISSDSDGELHRGDYVPNEAKPFVDIHSNSAAEKLVLNSQPAKSLPVPRVKREPATDKQATAPIVLPTRPPANTAAAQGTDPLLRSQATPVTKSSDFDWEKFFNDQN